jgi:hypothetical protein
MHVSVTFDPSTRRLLTKFAILKADFLMKERQVSGGHTAAG